MGVNVVAESHPPIVFLEGFCPSGFRLPPQCTSVVTAFYRIRATPAMYRSGTRRRAMMAIPEGGALNP